MVFLLEKIMGFTNPGIVEKFSIFPKGFFSEDIITPFAFNAFITSFEVTFFFKDRSLQTL
jgi:hypothetical protein